MTLGRLIAVALGGAAGALLRYIVSLAIDESQPSLFPFGTLTVNLLGCFAMGVLWAWLPQTGIGANGRLLLTTGMLGALTTFSTFSLQTFLLLETEAWLLGIANIVVSVVLGLLLLWLGIGVGRMLAG